MKALLHRFWNCLGHLIGNDSYERYLAHHRTHHPDTPPMTRSEYFRRRREEAWSRISRGR